MSVFVWAMVGIAFWHFAVLVPDRFYGGIIGAFLAALGGALVTGFLRPTPGIRPRTRPCGRGAAGDAGGARRAGAVLRPGRARTTGGICRPPGHVRREVMSATEHASDEALAGLVARADDAVIVADASGAIRYWNAAAEAMFGHAREEAIGASLDIIIPEKLRGRHWDGYRAAPRAGGPDAQGLGGRALT